MRKEPRTVKDISRLMRRCGQGNKPDAFILGLVRLTSSDSGLFSASTSINICIFREYSPSRPASLHTEYATTIQGLTSSLHAGPVEIETGIILFARPAVARIGLAVPRGF